MILLMGRLIKLTEMVVSRGVPFADVARMIIYLMPSFLVFTIPMAFLLAVLLAFGRLSADNEITVIKSCGVSLVQIMPPVLLCAVVATVLSLVASIAGVPWGNSSFKALSVNVVKQNASATIREKIFWDEIPGVILYTDSYDELNQALKGVIIHDGRNPERPMTIFASRGSIVAGKEKHSMRLSLSDGSIHSSGKGVDYRLVHFGEYIMSVGGEGKGAGVNLNELDMKLSELSQRIADPATDQRGRLKMLTEYHSRFAFPFASIVFAFIAVPLGIQNRRSGKSAGFSASIAILLAYYLMLSLVKTLAERGSIPPLLAMWIPNVIFIGAGFYLLQMTSTERGFNFPSPAAIISRLKRVGR